MHRDPSLNASELTPEIRMAAASNNGDAGEYFVRNQTKKYESNPSSISDTNNNTSVSLQNSTTLTRSDGSSAHGSGVHGGGGGATSISSIGSQLNLLTLRTSTQQSSPVGSVEGYEASIHRIQHAFCLPLGSDPELIINKFTELETSNFSLFSYINTVNSDIELFEHSIDEMRKKIDLHRGKDLNENEEKKLRNKAIVDKLNLVKNKISMYEEVYKESLVTMESLKSGVHNILGRIGSSPTTALNSIDPLSANFNNSDRVEVSDLVMYIGLIEQRTNEILLAYAASQQHLHASSKGTTDSSALQLPTLANSATAQSAILANSNMFISNNILRGVNEAPGTARTDATSSSKRKVHVTSKLKSAIPEILNRTYGINMSSAPQFGANNNDRYAVFRMMYVSAKHNFMRSRLCNY